jgi:hypothetical protein
MRLNQSAGDSLKYISCWRPDPRTAVDAPQACRHARMMLSALQTRAPIWPIGPVKDLRRDLKPIPAGVRFVV